MNNLLEVCVDSVQSLRNAEEGGADRVELCQALEIGGVTASYGLMRRVKELASIPVFAIIRPRAGCFVYNEAEIRIMTEDIRRALDLGINGFVFGALTCDARTKEFEINGEVCHTLINESCARPITFHRAFDLISRPLQGVSKLIDIGFTRLLTSGQKVTAYEGRQNIQRYIEKAGKELIVMPGCGINPTNLEEIMKDTGAKEFHSSCTSRYLDDQIFEEYTPEFFNHHYVANTEIVQDMINILRSR